MLKQLVDKQRRAVRVVKAALLTAGFHDRAVCVTAQNWIFDFGESQQFAVFVAAPAGQDVEPFFETGSSLVEAVNNMRLSIKGKYSAISADQAETAPF